MQRISIRYAVKYVAVDEKTESEEDPIWKVEIIDQFTSDLGSLINHEHYDLLAWHLFDKNFGLGAKVKVGRGRLGNNKVTEIITSKFTIRCLGTRHPQFYEKVD